MKFIILTLLITSLPQYIFAVVPSHLRKVVDRLDALAESSTPTIGGSIALKEKGFLTNHDNYCFVYEGFSRKYNRSVQVKFYANDKKALLNNELEIFIYLNAYGKPEVEKFGIPMIHHHGEWEEFSFIATSTSFKNLLKIVDEGHLKKPLNVLIILRNFIIQSKYMHSCGVRHDHITPGTFLIKGHQTFLRYFYYSSKIKNYNRKGVPLYASRRYHLRELRYAIDDFESFFYSMLKIVGVPLKWFDPAYSQSFWLLNHPFKELKNDIQAVRELISNESYIPNHDLREIFKNFADGIYDDSKKFPDYNKLGRLVTLNIMKYNDNKSSLLPSFTWLTDEEKMAITNAPFVNIGTQIRDPQTIDYESFLYPNVTQFLSELVAETQW